MTAEFGAAFQQFETDFNSFEGSLKVFPLRALPKLFYKGLEKTEDDLTDCFEFILSQKPLGPSGGGGGQDGEGPGTTVSTGDGPIGEGQGGGTCAVVITIPCGCEPAHEPGQHCACGTGNDSDEAHNQPYQVIIFVNCADDDQKADENLTGKNLDPEDCPQLLSSIGVVPRNLNELPGGEQLTELIEAAVNETCFNQLAIEHILDVPALVNCTGGNLALGPDCITSQVVAYLNSLELRGIPGTPLQVQFSESMPQHQLAAFLHAAVAGEGNEHTYSAINYAIINSTDEVLYANLPESLLLLSIIHENALDYSEFTNRSNNLINIVSNTENDLTFDEKIWLVLNPEDTRLLVEANNNLPNFNLYHYIQIITNHSAETSLDRMLASYVDWSILEDGDTPALEFENPVLLGDPNVFNGDFSPFQKVAALPPRPGYDETDMCTDCWDHAIQYINEYNVPEANHWITMRDLFETTTYGRLDDVGESFIQRFENNIGGEFHHADLTRDVMAHQSTRNTVRYFGDWFSARLRVTNGDINFSTQELNPSFRPKFPNSKLRGLTILVNDTYKTDFRIVDIQINQQDRTWNATIGVEIHDHFGVDFEDALDTQEIHPGFSSWFHLQHQFNHLPFVSVMKFTIPVEGHF